MATNNKNFIVKNGIDVGENATVTGSLTAAGLNYPTVDGDAFQAIITDGAGNLSFANVDTVESDVTNQTGSLIPKGTPVYQTGAAGNTLTIAPSDASDSATMPAIGVAASDIAAGSTGRVLHFGYIHGVDTSAFTEGDRIYVADGGGYQVGRPTGEGNVVQFLGVVTKVHATNGSGVVFGGGRAHAVPNLDDGNIFIGDNTNSPVTATLDTSIVPENGNIYFTNQRAIDAIEGSTNLTIDGGTLYIDTSNNYIGINDTSPQQALDVTGAIAIGGTTVIDSGGEVVTAQLKNSGVTAGSYGSASLVPIITVDSKGRITSASTTSVAGVSNFTFNNTTDVLTISTADGGSYTSDISGITVGGSMDGPLANLTVKYQSTAPTSPSQGQIYFDSLNQLLMIYTGSSWVQTIPSSSGGGGTSGVTDAVATFQKYTYTLSSTTNAVSGASEQVVDAGDFTIGKSYQIRTVGDTDFTAIGASANTVGTVFVATGVGEGTGDAYTYLAYSTAGAQNVEVFVNGVKQVEGASNDYVATTGTAVTFTYNIPSGSVVDVQIYELLTQDAFYLKSETYTKTETNSQISSAVSAYLPLTGGTLTGALTGTTGNFSSDFTVDGGTLKVDSTNGRVGIGTASPTYKFDVIGDTNYQTIKLGYTETANTIQRVGIATRNYQNDGLISLMSVYDDGSNAVLNVGGGTTAPDNIEFRTGATSSIKLNIDSAGNIVFVPSNSNAAYISGTWPNTFNAGWNIANDSFSTWINYVGYQEGTSYFRDLSIGDGKKNVVVRVDGSSGFVGIGTTTPSEKLDVAGTIRSNNGTGLHVDPGTSYARVDLETTNNRFFLQTEDSGFDGFGIYDGNNNAWRMSVLTNGNVGVGTTSPGRRFEVVHSSTNVAKFTGATNAYVDFEDGTVTTRLQNSGATYFGPTTNHGMFFRTNSTDRMLITNGGKVGINASSPTAQLEVGGDVDIGQTLTQTNLSDTNNTKISKMLSGVVTNTSAGTIKVRFTFASGVRTGGLVKVKFNAVNNGSGISSICGAEVLAVVSMNTGNTVSIDVGSYNQVGSYTASLIDSITGTTGTLVADIDIGYLANSYSKSYFFDVEYISADSDVPTISVVV